MSKKGCYNEKCVAYKKHTKYEDEYMFCPICANELAFICETRDCHEIIVKKLKYCDDCVAEKRERKEYRKQQVAAAVKAAGVVVSFIGTAAGTALTVTKGIIDISKK